MGYRIDRYDIPWWLVAAGMVLAVVAATGAAWWPGRTMSRIPPVLALSGRPPRPPALHRSALVAMGVLAVGVPCLSIGSRNADDEVSTGDLALLALGTVGLIAGVLLVSPIAVRAVARVAGRVPFGPRVALRDLGRYQARSAAAVAAIGLALGIPVTIVAAKRGRRQRQWSWQPRPEPAAGGARRARWSVHPGGRRPRCAPGRRRRARVLVPVGL